MTKKLKDVSKITRAVFHTLLLIFVFISCNSKTDKGYSEQTSAINQISQNVAFNNTKPLTYKNTTLASWNIRDLGRTKNPEELKEIANILRNFDIVAIQEVVAKDPAGAQAVAKIADELNRMGSKWDYRISDPTRSPSVYISERYAFLWKTSKVSLIHRAYLDKELEDICNREPYIAAFKIEGQSEPFYVINFHSRKYNDRPEEEIIDFLDYPTRLKSSRIIIAGDFNLDENHKVWKPFYNKGFKSALQNTPTTLKMKCKNGEYLNHAIDNIYFTSSIKLLQSGSVDIVDSCHELEWARALSDHLPVFMEFKFEEYDNN
ncbi:endonuclease/exonuclease/phosphatase family protein [Aequorivita sp. CIP111184]|uniref:endonuclease/exonuclease/phosphatase family protein n=1 Tax=Aequorivita sp. CIP111184 TaxID=2211356 RepID=UPI000DBC3927|nr:endonuclease/exonuclease/phosphatase family protein [Aequorivita sp. CIP111184]SRX54810.1 Deoxyribonuclease [Aequorivita sp. CIP111184]